MNRFCSLRVYSSTYLQIIEGWKQFDYPKENKQVAITVNDEEITFCAAKDYKQYYGTSWTLSK